MSVENKVSSKRVKVITSIFVALICLLTILVGVFTVSAGSGAKNGEVFSCDFDGNLVDKVSNRDGKSLNTRFSDNALHINNGHKAGNSQFDANSYVEFDGIKALEQGDFTISFDYFANRPTNTRSVVLSTGSGETGFTIFNKSGLGLSIGGMVMKTQTLTENEIKKGFVRLDSNLLNDGNWHNVHITVERGDEKNHGVLNLYVDGFFVQKMNLDKIAGNKISNSTLIIGADANKKFGSEDMYIDNLRIYDKVCDKNGNVLHDEYKWLVATKKANVVIKNYSDLADQNKIQNLKSIIQGKTPTTKEEVEACVSAVNSAIDGVIDSAKAKQNMNFQVLSDTHMATSSLGSKNSLMDSLKNIGQWFNGGDALVVTGDLTDNGYDVQYEKFYDALRKENKAPYMMAITGNHESSYNDTTMTEDNARFLKYNNAYTKEKYGWELDKVYYDKWVNGYHFIGLGSEETLRDGGYGFYSAEQIQFLKDKLKEAESGKGYDPSKPIFVFNHQPLNNTIKNSDVFGVGPQSDELTAIFRDYPQIVYISGHVHNGYVGAEATYNEGYGTLIDAPCLRANEAVRYTKSIGYHIALYKNKVIVTPVNFTDDDIMHDMAIVISDSERETKTAKYDYNDITVEMEGRRDGVKLVDKSFSSYCIVNAESEITFTFNEVKEINGVRVGTTFFNKPEQVDISVSADGKTFGNYKTYNLNVYTDLQKLFMEEQNVKAMKVKFPTQSTITAFIPTIKA